MMTYKLKDVSIPIEQGLFNHTISHESIVDITRASNVLTPAQLLIPGYLQTILCFAGWCSMAIGSYYRSIVYNHLSKEYKKKNLTPINILIIFSCLTNHLGVLMSLIYETLVVYYGENLENITGYEFCSVVRLVFGFDIFYSFISGLGIAIYRILLIKRNQWVKYGIGEDNLLLLILLSGLSMALGFSITVRMADSLNIVSKNCIMVPGYAVWEIIGQYQQSLGYFPSYLYINQFRRYLGLTLVLMTLAELTIYICFFRHIYKNDNSKSLLKALGPKVIKSRNKKNALTFFSQFCSFIFQVTFMLLMLFASFNTPNKSHAYILATFLKKISFATMTFIEVITSRRNLNAIKF